MNNQVSRPLPEGVHDSFTYTCLFCSGTVKVVASIRLPHACKAVDDLARIIMSPESFDGGPVSCGPNEVFAARTATAILSAGYAKQRTIRKLEELDALPVGTVVIDRGGVGEVYRKLARHGGVKWYEPSYAVHWESHELNLPVLVIWDPKP